MKDVREVRRQEQHPRFGSNRLDDKARGGVTGSISDVLTIRQRLWMPRAPASLGALSAPLHSTGSLSEVTRFESMSLNGSAAIP